MEGLLNSNTIPAWLVALNMIFAGLMLRLAYKHKLRVLSTLFTAIGKASNYIQSTCTKSNGVDCDLMGQGIVNPCASPLVMLVSILFVIACSKAYIDSQMGR